MKHGIPSGYTSGGCRCPLCRAAHAAYQAAYRQERYARLARGDANPEHGIASTYTNWGCRCPACTEAHNEAKKANS